MGPRESCPPYFLFFFLLKGRSCKTIHVRRRQWMLRAIQNKQKVKEEGTHKMVLYIADRGVLATR